MPPTSDPAVPAATSDLARRCRETAREFRNYYRDLETLLLDAAAELDRLEAAERERDALIAAQIKPWRGGGYVVRLEYKHDGYEGGRLYPSEGTSFWYHFDDHAKAVAAVRAAAELDRPTGEGGNHAEA